MVTFISGRNAWMIEWRAGSLCNTMNYLRLKRAKRIQHSFASVDYHSYLQLLGKVKCCKFVALRTIEKRTDIAVWNSLLDHSVNT